MNRNGVYLLVVVLLVAVVGLGIAYKNERDKTSGIHISTDNGLTIEKKD